MILLQNESFKLIVRAKHQSLWYFLLDSNKELIRTSVCIKIGGNEMENFVSNIQTCLVASLLKY